MQQLSLIWGDSGAGRRSRGAIWLTRSWTPVPLAGEATSCSLHQQKRQPSATPPRPRCIHTGLLLWLICVEGTAVLKSSPLKVLWWHQPSLPTQLWLCLGMTCWNSSTDIRFHTLGSAPAPLQVCPVPLCTRASCWDDLSGPTRPDTCPVKAGSNNHRRFGLERTIDHLVPTLCHGQGHLPLNSGFSSTSNIQHINQHRSGHLRGKRMDLPVLTQNKCC